MTPPGYSWVGNLRRWVTSVGIPGWWEEGRWYTRVVGGRSGLHTVQRGIGLHTEATREQYLLLLATPHHSRHSGPTGVQLLHARWRGVDHLGSVLRNLLGGGPWASLFSSFLFNSDSLDPSSFPSRLRVRMRRSGVMGATLGIVA